MKLVFPILNAESGTEYFSRQRHGGHREFNLFSVHKRYRIYEIMYLEP